MDEIQQQLAEISIMDDLDELDKVIIRFKLEGRKIAEISENTGKHRDSIAKRLKKVKVQQAIKELQKTALQILLDGQNMAARELVRQVKSGETDRDKRDAAKEILKGVLSENHNLNLSDNKFEIILKDVSEK